MKDIARTLDDKIDFYLTRLADAHNRNHRIDIRYYDRCLRRIYDMQKIL